jgi:23S rRNA (pseudouridine1915-N3)-methyltransferase
MRLLIAAVGRLKDGPERELYQRYAERIAPAGRAVGLGPLDLIELAESRAGSPRARADEEAQRLLGKCDGVEFRVALEERGKQLSSVAFASAIRDARDRSAGVAAFLIGGPDGHGAALRDRADLLLSISAMTLPHGLARIVLAEQIYRAVTIMTGHPYHRP